ncbi:MAG: hypothetical protein A3F54_01905 [Candidatus Kerfeldbacteria bacterium RIFCSPHIGHO2_12_FULL_48_17]|uniref:Transcription regulator TrmB N-terminal domain-containing protein n=1 Tax=Candidatus Kerfeldbacteria bacterium RIFCSPHIGHO2_12_FULL_48_17 TaxID=1798542 RepID=A0A1G2AWW6_9BACT|nr:MAG: hypothetical protein A3F54_01905 [Candidatus Kerfeldbacteria bacterium RIFCSPHIGHO2_12_FULL_48_17]
MHIKDSLLQLGLNKNEAAVYLTLLTLGLSQAGPLVKTTKLHRMLVYNALDRLMDEGLVSVLHKKNIKLFQVTDPGALLERTQRLNALASDLLPQLRKIQEQKPHVVNVRTLVGPEGFRTNLKEIVESAGRQKKRLMYIIGGAKDTDFYDALGDWYPQYLALLEKHEVEKFLLAPASFSSVFKKKFAAEPDTHLRTLPQGLSSPTYTRITEDMVAIEIYHPEIVIIQIRNKAIARGYLDSFQLLWQVQAKT